MFINVLRLFRPGQFRNGILVRLRFVSVGGKGGVAKYKIPKNLVEVGCFDNSINRHIIINLVHCTLKSKEIKQFLLNFSMSPCHLKHLTTVSSLFIQCTRQINCERWEQTFHASFTGNS